MDHRPAVLAFTGAALFLGGRLEAATIVVNDVSDTLHDSGCAATGAGTCTLRDAITFSNANAGKDEIDFKIAGTGVQTITFADTPPDITDAVVIDGYTQEGASPNTNGPGLADNAVLRIQLASTSYPLPDGLVVRGGNTTIRGLILSAAGTSTPLLTLTMNGGNTVEGNFIETNPDGSAASLPRVGIRIETSNNKIGGATPAARNVLSGGYECIWIGGDSNVIQGNFIGVDVSGTQALPWAGGLLARIGIRCEGSDNIIGGAAPEARNIISGNNFGGLYLSGTGNVVEGNFIGTDVTGSKAIPNVTGIQAGGLNRIGGTGPGEGNLIAFNKAFSTTGSPTGGAGVLVLGGSGLTIRGNSIFSNDGPGIDLSSGVSGDGPDTNDDCDADTGPNDRQNYPVITSVERSGATTTIHGTLNSTASSDFTLDFYSGAICGGSPSQTYLGSLPVATNESCEATFVVVLPVSVPDVEVVTATATNAAGSTSEFFPSFLCPDDLEADPPGSTGGHLDGVFEPNEPDAIEPIWRQMGGAPRNFTGTATNFTGPPGATYTILKETASYTGTYNPETAGYPAQCNNSCYQFFIDPPAIRPAAHWDTTFQESLSDNQVKIWTLHVGYSFQDVPSYYPFYKKIETAFHNGITLGCTPTTYCPFDDVPRSQMAIFIARAIAKGGANVPASGMVDGHPYDCVSGGVSLFTDVAPTDIACKSVHYIAARNVTTGCGAGRYCPTENVSRAQMAIFIAKAIVAPGGGSAVPATYGPDPVTHLSYSCAAGSPDLHFLDIATSDVFCKHVHYLWAKGVIAGCAGDTYCPDGSVTRQEMAKFLSNGFGLRLYGP
ncbi:MAG TPA: S-layer homology domain-containing protein [Thermoanaerobaculia bacterium]|nr:S-layer homology domain-containing protein [Thermoanaerobaculia bacterium]